MIALRLHLANREVVDCATLEFPQPREFRILQLRCGGIPVWSQQAIVGLPAAVDERIGQVPATEFDPLFADSLTAVMGSGL